MAPAVSRKSIDAAVARARHEAAVVVQHGGHDAGRAVGRRGHDPAAGRVLLVHRQREQVHPVEHRQRVARAARGREACDASSAARRLTFRPPGSVPSERRPRSTQRLHHVPDLHQAGVDRVVVAPVALVVAHHLRDRQAVGARTAPAARRPCGTAAAGSWCRARCACAPCRRRPVPRSRRNRRRPSSRCARSARAARHRDR